MGGLSKWTTWGHTDCLDFYYIRTSKSLISTPTSRPLYPTNGKLSMDDKNPSGSILIIHVQTKGLLSMDSPLHSREVLFVHVDTTFPSVWIPPLSTQTLPLPPRGHHPMSALTTPLICTNTSYICANKRASKCG
jgi:hypothetical protein